MVAGAGLAGLAGGGVIAGRALMGSRRSLPPVVDEPFPPDFVWGASTSAYQIEGAVAADGRGMSIWDTFARVPGNIAGGDSGEVACDHYNRHDEDVALMAGLGLRAYRFSIAWPRVLPEGTGQINASGLDFYDRLVDSMLAAGIAPWPCLYHWDLPQTLQNRGGWLNRDIADWFADYAAALAARLGDRVDTWLTLNEPSVVTIIGHCGGTHAPGLKGEENFGPVAHHQNLAHGRALAVLGSDARAGTRIGTALSLSPMHPRWRLAGALGVEPSSADVEAAALMDALWNRAFLDPLLLGGYPGLVEDRVAPFVRDGDMELIGRRVDFIGLNYYAPAYIEAEPGGLFGVGYGKTPPGTAYTGMGWPIDPVSLYDQFVELRDRYGNIAVIVTENGAGYEESEGPSGRVEDDARIAYLHGHVAACRAAVASGCNLQGYLTWTLLDNFEWAEGYAKRFGLVAVDRVSQQRRPKKSYGWYADLVRANRLPSPLAAT